MSKIYFCVTDYPIAETLGLMDNTVYETTLEEWLKLTDKIFLNPEKYIDREICPGDIPLKFSTDENKIHEICKAMFCPFEDTYPETGKIALEKEMNQQKEEEGRNHTLKVA